MVTPMPEIEHPNLAVMFTDIKGYSRLMSEDEARALAMLSEHNEVMERVIGEHGGRIVKKLGDAYMVIFDSAAPAVECALAALNRIAERNRQQKPAMEIRIGVHEGAMLEREGDYFGENVNIAARLEQMANPMTIAASERVVQVLATRINAEARFDGARLLKNIRYPVSVYLLSPADNWKLIVGDEAAPDADVADVLGDVANADAAWERFDSLAREGDLPGATRLAEAALSRFGGTYGQYAHLAAMYTIAHMETEAQSALRLGDMLGRREDDTAQYDWIQAVVSFGEHGTTSQDNLAECLSRATEFANAHPHDLPMQVLIEGLKARATGHLQGFATLAQGHPNSALVLRGYAEALRDHHQESDAYRILEQAMAAAPEVADHQLRRVHWMVDGGELDAALEESDTLAKRYPDDARVFQWTGMTRLLNFDPHGAQWIFEQAMDNYGADYLETPRWLACSMMHQGRFDNVSELSRKEMRNAIRQARQRRARAYMTLAAPGHYLGHSDSSLEVFEEYLRYDGDWAWAEAGVTAIKFARKLVPWDRAFSQLNELALARLPREYPHPSGLVAAALLGVVREPDQWAQLHGTEFFQAHRDWIIERRQVELAALETRGALRFNHIEPWHHQLVCVLTHLPARLDPRLPSFLALAGLLEARLGDFEKARGLLEQSRKLWRNAQLSVWEIQEAESVLAAGPSAMKEQGA